MITNLKIKAKIKNKNLILNFNKIWQKEVKRN